MKGQGAAVNRVKDGWPIQSVNWSNSRKSVKRFSPEKRIAFSLGNCVKKGRDRAAFPRNDEPLYRVRHAAAEAATSMSNAATVAQVAKPKLE